MRSSRGFVFAEYNAGRDALTLHSATQIPVSCAMRWPALDMPGHQLRVVASDVGGGFGGKGSLYPEELFVCAAARHLARPVKWTSDRLEDLTDTSQAFDEIVDAELGLDREGRILALRADVIGDVGAYSIYPWTAALEPVQVVSFLPGPYRIQHYRGRVKAVATSKAPTGPYRGVGRPISTFVMERLMDMAAARTGIDPKEIRMRNFVQPEEFPYKIGSGIVWDDREFASAWRRVRQVRLWVHGKSRPRRAAGRWFGIDCLHAELTGSARAFRLRPACRSIPALKPPPSASIPPAPLPRQFALRRMVKVWRRRSRKSWPNIRRPHGGYPDIQGDSSAVAGRHRHRRAAALCLPVAPQTRGRCGARKF